MLRWPFQTMGRGGSRKGIIGFYNSGERILPPYIRNKDRDNAFQNKQCSALLAMSSAYSPSAAVTVVPIDGEYRHCDVRNLMWKLQASSTKIATKNETDEAA